MLSKKIFISKLVPPQKLPSWAQAAPRARDRGPSTPRYPTPPQDPLPGPTPSSAIPGTHSPPAPGWRRQWVPRLHCSWGGNAGGEVIPTEQEPRQLFAFG